RETCCLFEALADGDDPRQPLRIVEQTKMSLYTRGYLPCPPVLVRRRCRRK
ncbi:MAG TPA: hypothetical protein GX715_06185, partial [Armatimonadetes bacterium]|nr:hypothetical protein [Armatimonadota bacterium]